MALTEEITGGFRDAILKKFEISDRETFYRQHRDLKPKGIAELNEAGLELAKTLAQELAEDIDSFEGQEGGVNHA